MTSLKKSEKNSINRIIVIVGPTSSGKSALGIKIAKKINGEIISADSRQVYKGLDLASGKITKKEMGGIPHHCLDLVSPKIIFTAEKYAKCAQRAIKDILARGKAPIIVGGTGFYIDIALGRTETAKVPPDWKLRIQLEKKSAKALLKILKKLAPKRAKNIDHGNKRRLVRAIEIAKCPSSKNRNYTKKPFSNSSELENEEKVIWLGIKIEPEKLKNKIGKRLEKRLKGGMVNEIKQLRKNGVSWKRLDSLGLEPRWISKYLRGQISKEKIVEKLKTEIWRYSRRQMTWFKRNKKIHWISDLKEIKKSLQKL